MQSAWQQTRPTEGTGRGAGTVDQLAEPVRAILELESIQQLAMCHGRNAQLLLRHFRNAHIEGRRFASNETAPRVGVENGQRHPAIIKSLFQVLHLKLGVGSRPLISTKL